MKQQAALRGAQEAQLRQAMLYKDQDRADLRASQDWHAQQMGIPVEGIRGYTPQELHQMFGNTREAQMMRAAGMFRDNPAQQSLPQPDGFLQQVVDAGDRLRQRQAVPAPLPPEEAARQASAQRIRDGRDVLARLIADSGAIEAATKGQGMYRPTNDGGAFNTFYGTETVADPAVRSAVIGLKNAQIADKRSQTARRNATPIRGSGGHHKKRGGGSRGHGGSLYVEEERYGLKGQKNVRTGRWQPYPSSVNGKGGKKDYSSLI